MFINRSNDGANNLCGKNISRFRMEAGYSQRALADKMQLVGIDLDKNAIQRIECGKRFITDIELAAFAQHFGKTLEELIS